MNKQQFFDAWASSYDWLFPSVFYQAAHQQMLEHVNLSPRVNVLDIGCGTGRLLFRLLDQHPQMTGIGIDFSAEMLRQARQQRGDRLHLIFTLGGAEDLRFADGQFDAVFCTFSFMHYADPQRVFAEVSRVLRPGGQFYWLDPVVASTARGRTLPLSPRGIRLYPAGDREQFAHQAHLDLVQHHRILFVSLLSIFRKGEQP